MRDNVAESGDTGSRSVNKMSENSRGIIQKSTMMSNNNCISGNNRKSPRGLAVLSRIVSAKYFRGNFEWIRIGRYRAFLDNLVSKF